MVFWLTRAGIYGRIGYELCIPSGREQSEEVCTAGVAARNNSREVRDQEQVQHIARGFPRLYRRRDESNNLKRQWRAEQKAVSPTGKRMIHGLMQKDVVSHNMTLKCLALLMLLQVD